MPDFRVGPGIAAAMQADGTAPASDEIAIMGARPESQWVEAMGENGTIYRWVRVTNTNHRYSPGGTLWAKLQKVVDIGRSKGFKPYSGPVVDEPEEFRHGDPGHDCSSFVSLMYKEALGVELDMFTDAIADETDEIDAADALPGDIILYRYHDPAQQGVTFPHTGLWLDGTDMLDCQFPAGLGVHPLLNHPFEIHRARGL